MYIELPPEPSHSHLYAELYERGSHDVSKLPDPTDSHYVYAIACRPFHEQDGMTPAMIRDKSISESIYDDADHPPLWLNCALSSPKLVYVGYAKDVISRLTLHLNGDEDAALFTKLFPPTALIWLEHIGDEPAGRDRESKLRRKVNQMYADDGVLAWSELDDYDPDTWAEVLGRRGRLNDTIR